MKTRRVLVVDDDVRLLKFVRSNLQVRGYQVDTAADGEEALALIGETDPDLIILDIMMPRMNGLEVCRRVREWSQVPIIVLSARGQEKDKVTALDLGVDDYLTKPFSTEELLARVRAVMRRSAVSDTPARAAVIECGEIKINLPERRITVSGQDVKLTPTEFNLLQHLVTNAGKVLTHSMLLTQVWGPEYRTESEYLRVYVGRLRRKLEPDAVRPRYILTEPGVGYRFRVPEE